MIFGGAISIFTMRMPTHHEEMTGKHQYDENGKRRAGIKSERGENKNQTDGYQTAKNMEHTVFHNSESFRFLEWLVE
jgi:hypothetical protein